MPIDPQGMANPMPPQVGQQMQMPPMPMDPSMQGGMPPPMPEPLYDLTLKRCIKSGQLKVRNIAPEDFLLDPTAVKVAEREGRFFGDKTRMTRSDAKLKWKDKKSVIDAMPAYVLDVSNGRERQAREGTRFSFQEPVTDEATEMIEIIEAYLNVDYNNDGVAEWIQVCAGDTPTETTILSVEECGDLPYVSLTPNPMPHRYRGRSIYDDVADIQRVKSVLLRQGLDNLYLTNNAQIGANEQAVVNKDALANPELGQIIWTQGTPAEAIQPIVVQFVAEKIFPMLEYFDMTMEKRTGVSRSTMALDTDVLQYQTAAAVNKNESTGYAKVEDYARNIAECGGLKELFTKLLKLYVQNQKSVKNIKVRGQWVALDPRGWNADMKVNINVGLGAGSRDKDLATLGGIAQKQELAIQALQDPLNPILNISHAFATYRRMGEVAGLKGVEQYFPEITPEQVQQLAQQKAQNQQPPPEVMKIQGQMQIEQAKLQGDQQKDANRAQLDQAQAQQKANIEKLQAEADIATLNKKVEAEIAVAQQKAQMETQQSWMKFHLEMAGKKADLISQSAKPQGVDAMGNSTGPDPAAIQAALAALEQVSPGTMQAPPMMGMPQTPPPNNDGLAQAMQALAQAMLAPTEIVRDQTGRAVGSRKRPT